MCGTRNTRRASCGGNSASGRGRAVPGPDSPAGALQQGYLSKIESGSKAAGPSWRHCATRRWAPAAGSPERSPEAGGSARDNPAPSAGSPAPAGRARPTPRALGAAAATARRWSCSSRCSPSSGCWAGTVSPTLVLPVVTAQTRLTLAMAAAARDGERRALLVLAARYAEYTGWMAQEAGDEAAAIAWTTEAAGRRRRAATRSWRGTRWSGGPRSTSTGATPRAWSRTRGRAGGATTG